jgi:hypothetical protein
MVLDIAFDFLDFFTVGHWPKFSLGMGTFKVYQQYQLLVPWSCCKSGHLRDLEMLGGGSFRSSDYTFCGYPVYTTMCSFERNHR